MTATDSVSRHHEGQPASDAAQLVGDGPGAALPIQRLSHHRTTATRAIPAAPLANPRRIRLIDLRDASQVS